MEETQNTTETASVTAPPVDITPADAAPARDILAEAFDGDEENTAVKHTARKPKAKKAIKAKPAKKVAAKAKPAKKPALKAKGKAAKKPAAPKAKRVAGVKAQGNVHKDAMKLVKAVAKEKGVSPAFIVRLAVHKYVGFKEAA